MIFRLLAALAVLFIMAGCTGSSTDKPATTDAPADTVRPVTDTPELADLEPLEVDTTISPVPQEPVAGLNIAYINSAEILTKLPAVRQADEQVKRLAIQLENELKRRQTEFQEKYQRYAQDTSASEALLKARMQELEQLQMQLRELQYTSEQQLDQERQRLLAPILDKIDKAIEVVAKERGFTHVFDASAGGLVYSQPQFDATPLVLARLGVR